MTVMEVGVGRARRLSGVIEEASVRRYSWQFWAGLVCYYVYCVDGTTNSAEEVSDEDDQLARRDS